MSSDFDLKQLVKNVLIEDITTACASSDSSKVLICDKLSLDILNSHLSFSELIDLGLRRVEGLLNYREADIEKGAIYFCFPTEEGIKAFLKDFEDDHPKYKEAIFISPCPTPDEPFELVRKSPARQYLISWKDCAYNFSIFDERSFHFQQSLVFESLYTDKEPVELVDAQLESIAERLLSVLSLLKHSSIIRYYDPDGTGSSLAARLALKVYQQESKIEDIIETWPEENREAVLVILDRSIDPFSPLMHRLSYQAAINDLLEVENGNVVKIPGTDESKQIVIDLKDTHFTDIRHLFIGDAAEVIQDFIDKNPAAASFYGGNSKKISPNDIKDQIYALNDATKIVDHRTIIQALIDVYGANQLEVVVDLEQRLVTEEDSLEDPFDKDGILDEVKMAIERNDILFDDKLRLLLLCKFKFPDDDLSFLLSEDISSKGADGLAGATTILEMLPKETSEKKWKYTHQGWKAFLRNNNLPPIPVDPENFLDRFRPNLSRVIEDIVYGSGSDIFPFIEPPPKPEMVQEESIETDKVQKKGQGSIKAFKSDFIPNWGREVPDDPDYHEVVNYFENGARIIFFCIGGISISEIQSLHELSRQFNRGLLIGSTHIIKPNDFSNELCYLGERKEARRILPSVTAEIEKEKEMRNKRKQEKHEIVLAEQREKQARLDKQKELERAVLEKQKELEIKEQEKEKRMMAAFEQAEEDLSPDFASRNFSPELKVVTVKMPSQSLFARKEVLMETPVDETPKGPIIGIKMPDQSQASRREVLMDTDVAISDAPVVPIRMPLQTDISRREVLMDDFEPDSNSPENPHVAMPNQSEASRNAILFGKTDSADPETFSQYSNDELARAPTLASNDPLTPVQNPIRMKASSLHESVKGIDDPQVKKFSLRDFDHAIKSIDSMEASKTSQIKSVLKVTNSLDDITSELPGPNRLDADEAAALAITPIVYTVTNPEKDPSTPKPSNSLREKAALKKDAAYVTGLFKAPFVARKKTGGMNEGARLRELAKSSLSEADAIAFGYDFSESDSITRHNSNASDFGPLSKPSSDSMSNVGYKIPPRRVIGPSVERHATSPAGPLSSSSMASSRSLQYSDPNIPQSVHFAPVSSYPSPSRGPSFRGSPTNDRGGGGGLSSGRSFRGSPTGGGAGYVPSPAPRPVPAPAPRPAPAPGYISMPQQQMHSPQYSAAGNYPPPNAANMVMPNPGGYYTTPSAQPIPMMMSPPPQTVMYGMPQQTGYPPSQVQMPQQQMYAVPVQMTSQPQQPVYSHPHQMYSNALPQGAPFSQRPQQQYYVDHQYQQQQQYYYDHQYQQQPPPQQQIYAQNYMQGVRPPGNIPGRPLSNMQQGGNSAYPGRSNNSSSGYPGRKK